MEDGALKSPALSAKRRERGPSVLERLRAEEASCEAVAPTRKRLNAAADLERLEATGSKSTKTGMALARAQLSQSGSGIVAAQERQSALVGKGTYRKAERVAREQPVGTLAAKDMPKKKKHAAKAAQFEKAFGEWMRRSLSAKVRRRSRAEPCWDVGASGDLPRSSARCVQVKQVRTAAAYEKMCVPSSPEAVVRQRWRLAGWKCDGTRRGPKRSTAVSRRVHIVSSGVLKLRVDGCRLSTGAGAGGSES